MEDFDASTSEARVDDDDSYIPRSDSWYYGEIPARCTREQLVDIMARALLKFRQDEDHYTGVNSSLADISEVMERWFEHDWNGPDNFDHLVQPDEDYDNFTNSVIAKACELNHLSLEREMIKTEVPDVQYIQHQPMPV